MESRNAIARICALTVFAALLVILGSCATHDGGGDAPNFDGRPGFASPDAAIAAILITLRADDVPACSTILGPTTCQEVLDSGDPEADRVGRANFVKMYDAAHRFEKNGDDSVTLRVGAEDWPFPIPIVRHDGQWYFDTEEGAEELIDRRVGRNELSTIEVCRAVVDAQYEYAARDRDGDGIYEYAQWIVSAEGKKDGLYWPTAEGAELSPLGELVAAAEDEGYEAEGDQDVIEPYHGYLFRLLMSQGENAAGGAYEYLADDHMIGGFALIAYPADYHNSGVMTFMVSHDGVIHQKDLGEETETLASAITVFDPDDSWTAVPAAPK